MVSPCKWYQDKRVQIDPWGTVWPCCWMGASYYTKQFIEFFDSDMNHVLENNLTIF